MATEERLAHLDAALKECIQQICSLQEEREMELDLKEANKKLICSLVCKQELVDELEQDKLQLEAELDSVEKENAFLKCECCALERQLIEQPSQKSSRKMDVLLDRLCDMEEENKVLREIIKAREDELCSSKLKCAQVAYRLAVMEAHHKDVDDSKSVDISGSGQLECVPNDITMVQIECMQQAASRNSLINHFIKDNRNQSESDGKQIVVAAQADANRGSTRTRVCWPWNVLDFILEEHQVSKKSINELLGEIRVSLAPQSCSETSGLLNGAKPGDLDLKRSISRMIELIEEISPACVDGSLRMEDYSVHVFRWRNSELISILRNLVLSCSLVLNGRNGLNGFVMQLASVLEWAVQNCITLDDASRVRDRVRKHFNLDRSKSETVLGDYQNGMTNMIKIQSEVQEKNELLMRQLEESRERIARLEEEVDDLKGAMEDQFEHQKWINEDLNTQLNVSKVKQNGTMQKLSSLEVELEDKSQCYEDLETTCLELQLQLQLKILSRKGSPYLQQEQQIGWEMISDCSKLALMMHETCKERGPTDEQDKEEKGKRRYSLRDRMFAASDEDDGAKIEESVCDGEMEEAMKHHPDTDANRVLAVVPIRKQGGRFGFIRKMFLRRKCSSNKASTLLQRNASTMMR